MRIDLFETVRDCLDRLARDIAQSQGLSDNELYALMNQWLEVMRHEWRRESAPSIPYNDAVVQLAYIYSHVAMNAQLINEVLQHEFTFSNVRQSLGEAVLDFFKQNDTLRICSFGSGPGTELLGFSKFLAPKWLPIYPVNLDVLRIDKVQEWSNSCGALDAAIASQFNRRGHLRFRTNFLPWDSSNADYESLTAEEYQFFIISYIVSELLEQTELETVADFLKEMSRASPGAIFLFIDRIDARTQENIDFIKTNAGLVALTEDTLSNSMDFWEDSKSSMRPYVSVIERMPRGSRNGGKAEAYFTIAKSQNNLAPSA